MLKITESGAKYSQISIIGEQVKQLERESGLEYLYLNQGVNAVVPIILDEVIEMIDFNSKTIQNYAPMQGRPKLKLAINKEYFKGSSNIDHILIDNGGMSGLDIVFQSIDIDKVMLPSFFWGSYANILNIRKTDFGFYDNFDDLTENMDHFVGSAVLICDPNNPLGNKFNDKDLIKLIHQLDEKGVVVIVDSPYRGVFYSKDNFYAQIGQLKHVIIVESFSKSIGLSGQRIGFIHSSDRELMKQMRIRLMYASNGVNAFAQELVELLLTTPAGLKAVSDFKDKTRNDILLNINYLREKGFLSEEFYQNSHPKGIFVVVKRSAEDLLSHRIASVSLSFFTRKFKTEAANHARICVSVPHEQLKRFFDEV